MKWLKIILINFGIILICIVILETIFGKWVFKKTSKLDCFYILCHSKINFEHDLYTDKKIVTNYSRDKFGLRNRYKDLDKIDILLIGGSTTDQRFIDDDETWGHILEKYFHSEGKKIDIVNAGIDGQTSKGHIWNFKNWFNKIDNLRSKYIIFYLGINEYDINYYDEKLRKSINRNYKSFIADNSGVIYPLYKIVKGQIFAIKNKNYHGAYDLNSLDFNYSENFNKIYTKYKNEVINENGLINNLNELLFLTENFGATPIFITQKKFSWKIKDGEILSNSKKNIIDGLREIKIGKIINKFCEVKNLICVDGLNDFYLKNDYFYDSSHFNRKGSTKFAKFLFLNLKEKLIFN